MKIELELNKDDYRSLYLALTFEIDECKKAGNQHEAEKLEGILEKLKNAARKAWPAG